VAPTVQIGLVNHMPFVIRRSSALQTPEVATKLGVSMKNLFLTFVTVLAFANTASAANKWECKATIGFSQTPTMIVRVEKDGSGYSAYLTASSDDVGPQWNLKDEKIATGMDCKFSKINLSVLHCVAQGNEGWTSITTEKEQIESVDQDTGKDKMIKFTNVIVSGSAKVFERFQNSGLKFGATDCSTK
jgi:hypothetical protein